MNVYPSDDGRAALIRLERGSDVLRSLDEAAGELGSMPARSKPSGQCPSSLWATTGRTRSAT
jgi:hypothetical protein